MAKMVKAIDRSPTLSHPFKLAIGGALVNADGGKYFPVKNPATEEVVAQCPDASRAQLDAAVAAAQKAFPSWSATTVVSLDRGDSGDVSIARSPPEIR